MATPRSVLPDRDELVDGLFVLVLTGLALVGFRAAYGGSTYLLLGLAGTGIGLVLAHLTHRARVPAPLVVVATLLVGVLLSGLALRRTAVAGFLPSLDSVRALPHVVVHGWKDLLTTVRPVGDAGDLLVLPYLLGLVTGVAGHSFAQRVRPLLAPLVPVVTVLGLSILLGADRPTSVLLQGAVFGGVALAWLAVRQARSRAVVVRSTRAWARPVAGLALLAVAGAGAFVVGPHLPGTHRHAREVLHVAPPLDPNDLTSPLTGFRRYTPQSLASLASEVVVTAKGLPEGTPVRLAVLDSYDGRVWGTSNRATPRSSGISGFARTGSRLPADKSGTSQDVSLTIGPGLLSKLWVPTVGTLDHLGFRGSRADQLRDDVRVNLATDSAVVPEGLQPGDTVELSTRFDKSVTPKDLATAQPAGGPILDPSAFAFVQGTASKLAGSAPTPMGKVLNIAAALKDGYYSDGATSVPSMPGHGSGRLSEFLQARVLNGDDEQYAAAMALMANAVGVPARVVLQVRPTAGQYLGKGVEADVQVDLNGLGWVGLGTQTFTPPDQRTAKPKTTEEIHEPLPKLVPPALPPQALNAPSASQADVSAGRKPTTSGGFVLPHIVKVLLKWAGPPLAVLLLSVGAVLALKRRRRRRRRLTGSPSTRIAMGWHELLDVARDRGLDVARAGTRREQGRALHDGVLSPVADHADAAVFGPTPPTDDVAATFWQHVDDGRKTLLAGLSRRQRWKAALSLRSLVPDRSLRPTSLKVTA